MKEFTKPYLASYGKASKLIQGECGWGSENYTLDKTGAKKWSYKAPVARQGVNYTRVQCEIFTKCSTTKVPDNIACRR